VIVVDSGGFGCDQTFSQHDIGRRGYVAGGIDRNEDGETVLTGRWRIDEWWGWLRKVR